MNPDGSGKTSIFRMLTTLLHPDNGSAEIEGFDVVKRLQKSGKFLVISWQNFLYQDLTVEEI